MTDDLQFYPTPSAVTSALLRRIGCPERVVDPCAGDGAILRVCSELGISSDGIELDYERARAAGVRYGDGLSLPWGAGTIIMNPPFTRDSWHPWAKLARCRTDAWILLPMSVLSAARHLRMVANADVLIYPKRITFDGLNSYTCCHAWFGLGTGNRHGRWGVLDA